MAGTSGQSSIGSNAVVVAVGEELEADAGCRPPARVPRPGRRLDRVVAFAVDARDDEVLRPVRPSTPPSADLGGLVVELVDVDGDVEAAGLDLECAVDVGLRRTDGLAEGPPVAEVFSGRPAAGHLGREVERVVASVVSTAPILARQARVGAVDRCGLQVVVVVGHDRRRPRAGRGRRAARRSFGETPCHPPRWTW
jgi:hypothetical protein